MHTMFWHLSNTFIGTIEVALALMVAEAYLKRRSLKKWAYYGTTGMSLILIHIIGILLSPSLVKMLLVILIIFANIRIAYEGSWKSCITICLGYWVIAIISDCFIYILWGEALPVVYINSIQYNTIRTLLGIGAKTISVLQIHGYYRLMKRKDIPFTFSQCILHLAPIITLMTIYIVIKYNADLCTVMGESILIISCAMGLLIGNLFTWKIFEDMIEADREKREYKYLQDKMKEQYSYYRNIENNQLEVRKIWHDMHNHVYCIEQLIHQNNIEEAKAYLGQVDQKISNLKGRIRTGHLIVDAVLTDKYNRAMQQGIHMKVQVNGELLDFMKDMDLCTIYGNLLDNALEACDRMKKQDVAIDPVIYVRTSDVKGVTVIDIYNTYVTPIVEINGELITTKTDSEMHGIGLTNIKNVIKEYKGELHIKYDENYFNVQIIF